MTKLLVTTALVSSGLFAQQMPVAQQNALVRKYCAVCHDDAHRKGGLSLQHFDAAHADPTVAAMLLSKLTNGLPLERIRAASVDSSAATAIDAEMKKSAILAAGVPAPDRATSRAWVMALSAEAAHAAGWMVNQARTPAPQAQVMTAGIIREITAVNDPAKADMYRLTLTCRADTREGEVRLAFAPGPPKQGQEVSATVDGMPPVAYKVDGHETMSSTGAGDSGPADMVLNLTSLPKQTLTLGNLIDGETAVFPFGDLPRKARQELAKCFSSGAATH